MDPTLPPPSSASEPEPEEPFNAVDVADLSSHCNRERCCPEENRKDFNHMHCDECGIAKIAMKDLVQHVR